MLPKTSSINTNKKRSFEAAMEADQAMFERLRRVASHWSGLLTDDDLNVCRQMLDHVLAPPPTVAPSEEPDERTALIITLGYYYDQLILQSSYRVRMQGQDERNIQDKLWAWLECADQQQQQPSSTGQTNPEEAQTCIEVTPASPASTKTQMTALRLLTALYHGNRCKNPNCSVFAECHNAKQLWKHVLVCKGCDEHRYCRPARATLLHFQKCKRMSCPVCSKFFQALPKLKSDVDMSKNQAVGMEPAEESAMHSTLTADVLLEHNRAILQGEVFAHNDEKVEHTARLSDAELLSRQRKFIEQHHQDDANDDLDNQLEDEDDDNHTDDAVAEADEPVAGTKDAKAIPVKKKQSPKQRATKRLSNTRATAV